MWIKLLELLSKSLDGLPLLFVMMISWYMEVSFSAVPPVIHFKMGCSWFSMKKNMLFGYPHWKWPRNVKFPAVKVWPRWISHAGSHHSCLARCLLCVLRCLVSEGNSSIRDNHTAMIHRYKPAIIQSGHEIKNSRWLLIFKLMWYFVGQPAGRIDHWSEFHTLTQPVWLNFRHLECTSQSFCVRQA